MEYQNINISTPTKISQKTISDLYCGNYNAIHSLFIEFEFAWFQQAYNALKDLDKYNIVIYLYKNILLNLTKYLKLNL